MGAGCAWWVCSWGDGPESYRCELGVENVRMVFYKCKTMEYLKYLDAPAFIHHANETLIAVE